MFITFYNTNVEQEDETGVRSDSQLEFPKTKQQSYFDENLFLRELLYWAL